MLTILFFFTLCSCILFYLQKEDYYTVLKKETPYGTWLDYVCYVIAGTIKYIPDHISRFEIPGRWLIFHLILLYGTLQYPYHDLTEPLGSHILLKGRSRSNWWIGKSLWCVAYILKAYIIVYATTYIFCFFMGESVKWKLNATLLYDMCGIECPKHPSLFVTLLAISFLYSVVMSWLQMLLMLWLKPIYSFLALIISMLVSAYVSSPFLIWNYAIPFRVEGIDPDGFPLKTGLILGIVSACVLLLTGIICFRRYDIYGKDDE